MKYLLYLGAFFLGTVFADPFSPSVSRQESDTIQKALEEAVTAPEAAAEKLAGQVTEKSSAAMDFTLGNLLFQSEKYPEAALAYAAALKKFPDFRDAKINSGRVNLLIGNPDLAIQLYQELVRDGVADAETYVLLGHALMSEGKTISAETAYRQALLLDENGTEARQGLLNCLLLQERYREVVGLSGELLAENPHAKTYWAARANAQLATDNLQGAARSLEQARRLGLADAEMLGLLGQLYLQEEISGEALERFREAFDKEPGSISKQLMWVDVLSRSGHADLAAEEMKELVEKMNAMPEETDKDLEGQVVKLNARIQFEAGNLNPAGEILSKYLKQQPMDGESLVLLGRIQQEGGKPEEARILFERASRIKGFEAEALVLQAFIEVDRKSWQSAAGLLERALVFEENAEVENYVKQLRRMADD